MVKTGQAGSVTSALPVIGGDHTTAVVPGIDTCPENIMVVVWVLRR